MRYRRPLATCLALYALLLASCAPKNPPAAVSVQPAVQPAVQRTTFNVKDFAATGDGATKDTAAFQKALNACAAYGGTVIVPAGNYLIGSVVIGSHTTMQFEPGAVLTASPDAN